MHPQLQKALQQLEQQSLMHSIIFLGTQNIAVQH